MQQVASGLLSSLSGNSLISPNYWLDPVNGVNYNVVTQAPIATTQSVAQIANISLTNGTTASPAWPPRMVLRRSRPSFLAMLQL